MKGHLVAFLIGGLFGLGLAVSGMANPARVVGFLDVAGIWDPSLLFVMMGALGTHALLGRVVLRLQRPVFAPEFVVSRNQRIDRELIAGAAIFGMGWGLGGYCPGPALVSLATRSTNVLAFVGSMTLGMMLYGATRSAARSEQQAVGGRASSPQ